MCSKANRKELTYIFTSSTDLGVPCKINTHSRQKVTCTHQRSSLHLFVSRKTSFLPIVPPSWIVGDHATKLQINIPFLWENRKKLHETECRCIFHHNENSNGVEIPLLRFILIDMAKAWTNPFSNNT